MARLRELFGRRLRELRTGKGYNQLYLATLASVSEDFISLVERGINTPSFETIEALAEALEVDVTTLFTFPGEQIKPQRVRMGSPKRSTPTKERAPKRVSPRH
jgi:transcriptional regulator with XRE-family HTH domain